MNAYKSGKRQHDMMKMIAMSTSDADVKHLARFSRCRNLKPRERHPAATQLAARRRARLAPAAWRKRCEHQSRQPEPRWPGCPVFRGGDGGLQERHAIRRDDEARRRGSERRGDRRPGRLLHRATAAQPKVIKPLTLAEWVQRCDRCHGINGNSTDPRTPAIAAQRIEYLQKALKAYQTNQRRDSVMAAMSASLTDADVASLAAFYARQKARPFVFVMIPSK